MSSNNSPNHLASFVVLSQTLSASSLMTQDESKGARKCPIRHARTLPAVGHEPSQTPGVRADLSGSSLRSCTRPTLASAVTQLRAAQTNSVRCCAGDSDSRQRHVVHRLHCRWKNNRGAGVRKPHIKRSRAEPNFPSPL